MSERLISIRWTEGRSVPARLVVPTDRRSRAVLLAHGAGGGKDSSFVVHLQAGLAEVGYPVLAFDYPYAAEGRRAPDRAGVLTACHRAAAEWLRREVSDDLVLAGKSMGGRMASHLAAEGEPCSALVFFGYPLHPAGRPDRLRTDHLPAIRVPMLFLAGTRDRLAGLDLLRPVVEELPEADLEVVEGGDHSFRVPKAQGRSWEEVLDELVARTVTWLELISPPPTA